MSFFRIIWRKITKFYYSNLPLEKVFFNKYYNPKYTWCRSDKGPSCVGSDNYTTKILRSKLPIFIKKYKIKSILDAGCGDFYWMKNINLIKINYYGLDIVSKLIEKNKKLYSKKNITFFKSNLVKDKLPKVDLIICRDVLTRSSQKNNILIHSPEKFDEKSCELIKSYKPDLIIVIAYGLIIPAYFLNIAKFGFINVHFSLLPHWRGAAPIEHTLLNGDKKTGVSIIKLTEKLDAGPILMQSKCQVKSSDTVDTLKERVQQLEGELFIDCINQLDTSLYE